MSRTTFSFETADLFYIATVISLCSCSCVYLFCSARFAVLCWTHLHLQQHFCYSSEIVCQYSSIDSVDLEFSHSKHNNSKVLIEVKCYWLFHFFYCVIMPKLTTKYNANWIIHRDLWTQFHDFHVFEIPIFFVKITLFPDILRLEKSR